MGDLSVILIGSNNKNTLGKVRSFGEAGYTPILIWVGPRANLVKSSRYVKEYYEFTSSEAALAFLVGRFRQEGKKRLVSVEGDGLVAELDKNYDKLKDYFIFYNAGAQGRLSFFLQKENLCRAAAECGLLVPRTRLVRVGDCNHGLNYPVFTKASDSYDISWKDSAHVCKTEEELLQFYSTLNSDYILLQEYVDKQNEWVLQGVSFNGGEDVYIPIQGSYYRLPDGAYGSFGYFELYNEKSEIRKSIINLLKFVKYSGIFEVEFLVDKKGTLFFLEINFRDTMWNYAFTTMGINLNKIWAESEIIHRLCIEGVDVKNPHVNFMNEFTDYSRYVKTHKIKFREWYKDFKSSEVLLIWNKNDIWPFFVFIIYLFGRKVQRLGFLKNRNFNV